MAGRKVCNLCVFVCVRANMHSDNRAIYFIDGTHIRRNQMNGEEANEEEERKSSAHTVVAHTLQIDNSRTMANIRSCWFWPEPFRSISKPSIIILHGTNVSCASGMGAVSMSVRCVGACDVHIREWRSDDSWLLTGTVTHISLRWIGCQPTTRHFDSFDSIRFLPFATVFDYYSHYRLSL